jgi:hypothetical protein
LPSNAAHPRRLLQGRRTPRQLKKSWHFFSFSSQGWSKPSCAQDTDGTSKTFCTAPAPALKRGRTWNATSSSTSASADKPECRSRHARCSGAVALASARGDLDPRPCMGSRPRRHPRGSEPVQQQSTAVPPLLSAVQRVTPQLSAPQQHSARALPSLCKQDVRVRVSRTVLQACTCHLSRGASLSFSLIRDRSAGFMIGCHACNRRLAVCSGH